MKLRLLIIFCSIFAFLLGASSLHAQNTTVSGTITDTPDGQAWFGGTLSFVFRVSPSNPTAQYFFNGAPFSSSQTIAGALDSSGHYSSSVPPNTSITPAGSTWDVTFCPLATAQCVTYQSVTITGATQTFAPSPPSIRLNLAVPLQNPRAYTDAEVVNGALGQSYFNLVISTLKLCNFFPCGWATLAGGGGNPANPVGSVQVNVAGSFGPGPQVSTVAIKPQTSDNICYVSQNGNDSNDGLSIGSAKLTVYSCLTTVLPGGTSTTAGNGTVLISGTVNYGGPVANQGFFLMGGPDPNFGSPPAGWLKVNPSPAPAITFDCFAKFSPVTNGHTPSCVLQAGNVSTNLPAIWLSSVGGNQTFNNIQFTGGIGNYIRYGIDSNNARTLSSGSEGLSLNNISMANGLCTNPGQTGPTIDIGGTSFWIWLKDNTLGGCPGKIFTVANSGAVRSSGVVTITTTATNDVSTGEMLTVANVTDDSFNGSVIVTRVDGTHFTYTNAGPNTTSGTGQVVTARSAAINMDPGPSNALVGLVFIDNTNLNGGNIRFRPGINGGTFYVRNVSYEGNFSSPDPPVVLITGTTSGGTDIKVENVEIADSSNLAPGVQVDNPGGSFIDPVVVSRIAGSIRGRMAVMGGLEPPATNATFLRKQQYGIIQGTLVANAGVDEARRGFSPVLAKALNLAAQNPASWTVETGTGTITSGIAAPDTTNNAGRITFSTGVPGFFVQFYSSTTALNLGDTYVFGAWVHSATNNGYAGGPNPLVFSFTGGGAGNGDACVPAPGTQPASGGSGNIIGNPFGSNQSDGQWQWYSGVCKVEANPTTPGTFFGTQVDSTHTIDIYAPTLALFPAGTISDNEAYELAVNMAPWPNSAATGEVSMLPNQRLHHGTTTFANLGTPNNASDIYCTDCVANSNPCVGTGTGAFAQGINGAWVCGGGGGGGGCAPGGITDALQYNGGGTCSFGGVNSPTVNGNYLVNYNVTASAAVPPTITIPGVPQNVQTGTTYTYLYSDRGTRVTANNSSAQTYTLVNPSNTGFGQNYFNILQNIGTAVATDSASGFTIDGGATLKVNPNWARWLWSDGVNYFSLRVPDLKAFPTCVDTGGNHINFDPTATNPIFCGTSASGNGLSGMTAGQVPIAASATSVTSSEALAGAGAAITTGPTSTTSLDVVEFTGTGGQIADTGVLFSNVWRKDAANISLAVNHDFSAGTWKIPAAAGFTAGATSNFGLDTTAKLFHCYLNNADAVCSALSSISPATTSNTIANGNNPQTWNFLQTTNNQNAFTIGNAVGSPSTGGTFNTNGTANQGSLAVVTSSNSTEVPLNITGGSQTGTTGPPLAQFQGTCNNASLVCKGLIVSVTNPSSASTSHLLDLLGGSAGTTNEMFVDTAGNVVINGGLTVTANLAVKAGAASTGLNYLGGSDAGSTGVVGSGTFRGGDNSNNTTSGAAGGGFIGRGGAETGATIASIGGYAFIISGPTTSTAGVPGTLEVAQSMFGSSLTLDTAVCATSTAWTVGTCGTTNTAWGTFIGITLSTGTPVPVVQHGVAPVVATAAVTIGHTACLSAVTANQITDSGGAGSCANGPTFVVIATSGTLNVINAAGTGVTTATLSTTLPAVRF